MFYATLVTLLILNWGGIEHGDIMLTSKWPLQQSDNEKKVELKLLIWFFS